MAEEELPANLRHLLSPSHSGRRKTLKKEIAKLITEDDEYTAQKRRQWLELIEQMWGAGGSAGVSADHNPQHSQRPEQQQRRHKRHVEIARVHATQHKWGKSQAAVQGMRWGGWNTQGLSRETL